MSAPIRSVLTVAVQKARLNLQTANDLLANNGATLVNLASASEMLGKNSDTVQKQLDKWSILLNGLAGAAKTTEEDIFDQYAPGGDTPGEIIVILSETIGQLDMRIDQIRASQPNRHPNPNGVNPAPPNHHHHIPLPPMSLMDFDGTPSRYEQFWTNFRDNVDQRPDLSPAQKLRYLMGQLKGAARDLSIGYQITDANYTIVKEVLTTRFGDDFKRAHDLRSELFRLPKASASTNSLRLFSEAVERICRQLSSLDPAINDSPYVVTAILDKLPPEIRLKLLEQERDFGSKWTAKQWRDGLSSLVQLREAAHMDREIARPAGQIVPQAQHRTNGRFMAQNQPRRAFPVVTPSKKGAVQHPLPNKPQSNCSLCERASHRPTECPAYPNAKKRQQRLTEQGRCHLCIRSGHEMATCSATTKCLWCNDRHHLIVCQKYKGELSFPFNKKGAVATRAQQGTRPSNFSGHSMAVPVAAASVGQRKGKIPSYLMMKAIKAYNHRDPLDPVSAPTFFDPGSQTSFIETDLTQEINPRRVSVEKMVVGGFVGNQKETFSEFISPCYSVLLAREDGGWEEVFLNQTEKITSSIDCLMTPVNSEDSENPVPCSVKPRIMIGVRDFWRFILDWDEIRPGIYRIRTVFGVIFGGEDCGVPEKTSNPSLCCPIINAPHPIESDVAKLWALETIGVSDSPVLKDDEVALEKFNKTIKKDKEGRYEVGLPWKSETEYPPENFRIAFSRFSALVHKLRDSPRLLQGCNEIIEDYVARGIIENSTRTCAPQHFLPHHTVMGKKLRIVFDASSHEKNVPSLNDTLYAGPNLYPDLAGKLIQFRATTHPIWADIEKAFLMVSLREEDREFSKFLWVKNVNAPLSGNNLLVYRFRRITFGIVSCPFLLAATLQHHLETSPSDLAKEIRHKSLLYVDNLLLLADCPAEAEQKAIEAQKIFSEAKMRLREYVAAKPELLTTIPEEDCLSEDEPSVLGLKWVLQSDDLSLSFPEVPNPAVLTRRIVLKTIASFFDPLGLCCPCLVGAKMYFQSLWDQSRGWDQPIENSEKGAWDLIRTQWSDQTILIPRKTPRTKNGAIQLHVFSDASPNVFATAVYLRAEIEGNVINSLIYARSRLKPKRMGENQPDGLTIPRLELLGVLIGARAAKFVRSHLFYDIESVHLWTDSKIVLAWISSTEKQPVFVSNRIREIRTHRSVNFHYVRSAENPADLATHPISPNELRSAKIWWRGPEWLEKPANLWPDELTAILPPEESPMPDPVVVAIAKTVPAIFEFDRFGSWRKLLGTAFVVLRFLSKIGKNKPLFPNVGNSDFLDPESQKFVSNWLFKLIQRGMLPPVPTYLDTDGLIRLKSRLCGVGDKDFEHPIFVPTDSWVLVLLIRHSHTRLLHAGVDSTLTDFLSKFWCKKARRTVRKIVNECTVCKKDRAVKFGLPPMPPLPKSRTRPSSIFEQIGIDFLGPTIYKMTNTEQAKAWILLITCLASRAVHLEIVNSLSADHFLLAFRRFVARRGLPRTILSDHGTQFVLAKNVLENCTDFCIKWTLIPAFSPWSGGVYERLNALIKNCFRRILGRRILKWEEISTFLTEVEAAINSRPITFVSDEADGPFPLRPIDFLSPKANLAFEEPDMSDEVFRPSPAEKLATRWWGTAKSIRQFWEKWSQEYLLLLRQRNQTKHKGPRIVSKSLPKVDQIVLVENEEFPRNTWPIGKITEVQGLEGNPRSANILMANGRILSRPVSKLVPLEEPPGLECETISRPLGDSQEGNGNLIDVEPISESVDKENPKQKFRWAKEPPRGNLRQKFKWAERPPRPSISASILNTLIPMLLVLSFFSGTAVLSAPVFSAAVLSAQPNATGIFSCVSNGVMIEGLPETEKVDICCDGICGHREYRKPFFFPIPEENLLIGTSCLATFWMGPNVSTSYSAQCAPVDICLLVDCYVCWERVFNFHCSPTFSALLIGCIALVVGILLTVFCCLLSWTNCFFRAFRRCCRAICCSMVRKLKRRKQKRPIESDSESDYENRRHKRFNNRRFRPLTKLGMALALICWFQGIPLGNGVPTTITANTEECDSNENGTECRFNSVTLLNLLPVGQSVDLMIRGPESILLGTLTFTLKGLYQECIPESLGFIRSYKIETLASKRCPGMGSCTGKTCENLLTNETVNELAESNGYPGNSYCLDSGSFWFNGCGGTNSACLFYRNYAVPTRPGNKFIYEMFRCPTWDFRIMTGIKINLHGEAIRNEEAILFSGHTFRLRSANLSITPAVFGSPAAPALSGKFIGGSNGGALIPSLDPALHCADEDSAKVMKCDLALNACAKCRPDHSEGVVRCHCRELDIERLLEEPSTKLPLSIGPLVLNYRNPREVWVESDFVPIQMVLKMEGLRLAIRHQMATCKIRPQGLKGCYKCRIGSRFSYTCTASYGSPLAEIVCENGANWAIPCSAQSIQHNTSLSFDTAKIKTNCKVTCPGGDTLFEMEGTLAYISSVRRSWRLTGDKAKNSPGGIGLPEIGDLLHVLKWIFGGTQLIIISAVLFVGICAFYIFLKFNPIFWGYRILARKIWITIFLLINLSWANAENKMNLTTAPPIGMRIKIFFSQYGQILGWVICAIIIAFDIYAITIILKEQLWRRGWLRHLLIRRDRIQPQDCRIADFRH